MASSVSSSGGSNNVMIRSKADPHGAAGGHATSMDERNTVGPVGPIGTMMGTTATATGVASAPERGAVTGRRADDSAISFSEEEEDEVDEDEDEDEEDDSGSLMADHQPESASAAFSAAAAAAAAAAFQRQLLVHFPPIGLFHPDGSTKMDHDPSSHPLQAQESSSNNTGNNNPFETYIVAAAAASAAAANAEALFRHQQQLTALSGGRSEKRTAAHDSGTDDNDLSIRVGAKNMAGSDASAGIHQQQPSNKRRKQSKPVRISSEVGGVEENAAVTAFLAAQTAALFHQNPNASSEEEEEGSIHPTNASPSSAKRMEWTGQPMMAGNNESEQEEGQIIRSSSASSSGQMLDHQLANRMLSSMAGNHSSRNLAEFLSGGSGGKGGGFPLFPPSAYGLSGGSWNQQQQMMMSMMAMNRSTGNNNGMMGDDGEVSRSSSHSSASPNGGVGGSGSHPDGKKNEESGGERSNSESPFAFRNMAKYGVAASAGGGFFPSSAQSSSGTFGPSTSSAPHPFLFPFLSSVNSPVANQPMRGAMAGSPSVGGGIRIFNHEAYCELCNKEFCNKYFLKTHKANKHGIYVDNMPTSSGGSTPSQQMDGQMPARSGPLTSTPTSSTNNGVPFSISSSFGPPLSLTVGAMTYPMHPPQTESTPAETTVSYSPIQQPASQPMAKPTSSVAASTTTTTTSSTTATTPTGMNAAAAAAAAAGLMDFFPLWSSTPTPTVTTVNNTLAGPPSLIPSAMSSATMKQHLPGGIVNPEAYCELCQKEFCNKYFLKRHKAKMHGIGTVTTGANSSGPAGSTHPTGPSAGGSTPHKKTKSQGPKIPSSAVDLIKIPLTLPVGSACPVTSPGALPALNDPQIHEQGNPTGDQSGAESNGSITTTATTGTTTTSTTTTTSFNLLMTTAAAGMKNETGSAKMDLNNSIQRTDSLSLLKIPTPSLSTLFSSTPATHPAESYPVTIHRQQAKTPCSSSSSGAGGVGAAHQQQPQQQQQQQLFSPERLRQMGVINTEAFCEICCKEFCNKYFLRTHKFKKHGIGSMPEQPQQQSQSMSDSFSSTGMVRQHHYNNNNNKNGSPATTKQPSEAEQKTPLNLASSSTPPTSAGSVQPQDGGMPLSCDLCQRPFQSAYLLHMHRTYFHNQPPPAEDSGTTPENDMEVSMDAGMDASTGGADEDNGSDNGEEDEAGSPPPVAVKSEPGIQQNADAATEESAVGDNSGVTISADLQKLQSMIMELNGSSSSAAAAVAASLADGDAALRRRCWMDSPASKNANPASNNGETGNNTHFISGSGGGIVKIVNPGDPASSGESNPSGSMSSTVCQLCGNKDFFTSYFLQMHMQNYHGIVTAGSNGSNGNHTDPSAAAMEAAVAAAASQLGLDRLLDFGSNPANGGNQGMNKRSGRSSSSASPAATRSYCQICNKELCNKYFMKTHMLKMHGIHLEASGGGAQIGGVQCDICHKELCSKYFLKVHKQNTHGIGFSDGELMPNGVPKDAQHQGVMDLSFHHQQPMLDSPSKSSTTSECCPFCPKRFKSAKALKAHLSHDHSAATSGSSGSSGTSTCCYICSQQFQDVVALQVHLIKSHASHLMDHQTPPPNPSATPSAGANANPSAGQSVSDPVNPSGSLSSSSSPSGSSSKTFQCSFCDFATGSLPYLLAHERSHHPLDRPPATTSSGSANHSPQAVGGGQSGGQSGGQAVTASQQKIQCPLCGQQLPLEQFQTHLMAHQLPISFLHTLMPSASTSAGPEMDEEEFQQQQQQQQQQQRRKQRRRRRYRCSVCSRKFATRQLCLTHILQRHPPSIRSGWSSHNNGTVSKSGSSPTSPVSCLVQQQRPLTCPRCGYATRQPQLLRLHLRTQQCIPVVARNPDLQQLPPYLAIPTSTASVGQVHAQSRAVNNNGLLQVQGQHAHRQDFVLQAFLLTQPDAADKSASNGAKNRRSRDGQPDQTGQQQNGHHQHNEDQSQIKRDHQQQQQQHNGRRPDAEDVKRTPEESAVDAAEDGEEEGQNQSSNFIPSLILLPVNRRIANPLSLTFSLTPA